MDVELVEDAIKVEPIEIEHDEGEASSTVNQLPAKSKKIYEKRYEEFQEWCVKKSIHNYNENVVLAYFDEKRAQWKPSTLWAHFSMLKAMMIIKHNIDLSKFSRLLQLIKKQNDGFKPKKSKVLSREQIDRFLTEAPDDRYLMTKVALIFGIAGACRRLELLNLKITDVQDMGSALVVNIRTADKTVDRVFTIVKEEDSKINYVELCRKYMSLRDPTTEHQRFFVFYRDHKCTKQPVGKNMIGKLPQKIAMFLKLPDATAYTGHCFRRSSASFLADAGVNISVLKRYGGWKSATITEENVDNSNEMQMDENPFGDDGASNSSTVSVEDGGKPTHICGMTFSEKVVLITGASSGIGAATAIYFSKLGAKLALTGRNPENLSKTSEHCTNKPLLIPADITNEDDIRNIIETTITHYGKLNVLVNNAGIIETGGIENTSLEQYERMFDTNVKSLYSITMKAVPYLIKTKGNIVNVSSITGIRASAGVLSYCMSKSAVDQFTRCVALDLAPKQVRVNSVNPGVVVTNLHRRGGMGEEQYEEFLKRCQNTHPLGRAGKPEEVAKTIAFLASEDASFITGAILPVDGGRQLLCPR